MKRILRVALMLVAGATRALSQDAAPCKESPCQLIIDWGSGKTASSFPPDRRYGGGEDFEARFRSAMAEHGYRLVDSPMQGATVMTVRTTSKTRVMCDEMAGTNPDLSCTAITALAVNFQVSDPKAKLPTAMRLSNRCASGDIFMINKVFAKYAADMIWYQLEGQAQKAEKPISNC